MKSEIETNYVRRGGPERLVVAMYPPDKRLEGKSMAEVSRILGVDPADAAMNLLAETDCPFVSHVINEEDAKKFMRWGLTMIGSDGSSLAVEGPLSIGLAAPAQLRDFPARVGLLREGTRRHHPQEAVRKMTSSLLNGWASRTVVS